MAAAGMDAWISFGQEVTSTDRAVVKTERSRVEMASMLRLGPVHVKFGKRRSGKISIDCADKQQILLSHRGLCREGSWPSES